MSPVKHLWERAKTGWMAFAHVLGVVNTTLILTLLYIVMVVPISIAWFLIRKDPLGVRHKPEGSIWKHRAPEPPTVEERRHPF